MSNIDDWLKSHSTFAGASMQGPMDWNFYAQQMQQNLDQFMQKYTLESQIKAMQGMVLGGGLWSGGLQEGNCDVGTQRATTENQLKYQREFTTAIEWNKRAKRQKEIAYYRVNEPVYMDSPAESREPIDGLRHRIAMWLRKAE